MLVSSSMITSVDAEKVMESANKRFLNSHQKDVLVSLDSPIPPSHGQVLVYNESAGKYEPEFIIEQTPKTGGMDKSVYDINNNGIVDKAQTLQGLTATIDNLNTLTGITGNVQNQIDLLIDNVPVEGNTLNKLRTSIVNILGILNSDDTSLDSIQEIVNYVKSEKELIDSITTGSIRPSDVINDFLHTDTDKPASASTVNRLKIMIDNLNTLIANVNVTSTDIMITDVANNFTSPLKNLENVIAELFQYAYSGKTSIANAIGSPFGETFTQLTNDINSSKSQFVINLINKGVPAVGTSSWNYLINQMMDIKNGNASSVKNTKLNMTAGSTHVEVLGLETPLNKLATSVMRYVPGATNVTEYTSDFNNADSSNFNYQSQVVFDGTMHLSDVAVDLNTVDAGTLVNGELFISEVLDKTKFNNLCSIVITDGVLPTIAVNGTCAPSVVIAKDSIDLNGVYNLSSINLVVAESGEGIVRMAVSINDGVTWKVHKGSGLQTVDITNKLDFKTNGMTATYVNSLTMSQLELLRGTSSIIKFAYYLEKVKITDIANNDSIVLKVDMNGWDIIAPQADWSYTFGTDLKTITYTINVAGTYTFVYADPV